MRQCVRMLAAEFRATATEGSMTDHLVACNPRPIIDRQRLLDAFVSIVVIGS